MSAQEPGELVTMRIHPSTLQWLSETEEEISLSLFAEPERPTGERCASDELRRRIGLVP